MKPAAKKAGRRPSRPKGDYTQPRRLLHLYDRLRSGGIIRPTDTAERFAISVRTLQRDILVLKEILGDRLVEEHRGKTRYSFRMNAREWRVTPAQVLAVFLGARLASFLSGPELSGH